jgi:hypothetical protein
MLVAAYTFSDADLTWLNLDKRGREEMDVRPSPCRQSSSGGDQKWFGPIYAERILEYLNSHALRRTNWFAP